MNGTIIDTMNDGVTLAMSVCPRNGERNDRASEKLLFLSGFLGA